MKQRTLLLILLLSKVAFSQKTFVIDDFSKAYFGELYLADTNAVFSEGWVAIFDKKSNKQLIKIASDELTFELPKGIVLSNSNELPYGEQSQILYEDYNFDGVKDFAIMDGQNSCYHGPSFQIFLATENGFTQSPEFTELAQNYCGIFNADHETKTLHTMTKSGCCWHQYSEFNVSNNIPYPIRIVEEGLNASGVAWDYEEQNLVNGKMVISTYQMLVLEVDEDNLVLSFEFENNKKMRVFFSETSLFYAFTDADDKLELLYYDTFNYSNRTTTLSFTNHATEYIIYSDKIIAKTPNNAYEMKAVTSTIIGTLTKLNNLKLANVIN
jgi:hypothetical protein